MLQSAVYCVRFVLGCFLKKMSDNANSNDSIQIDFEIRTMSGSANNSNDSDVESEMDFEFDVGERPGTPEELIAAAAAANENLLPSKSKVRYQKVYDEYKAWKEKKFASSNSERFVTAFFSEMIQRKKPSSLWAQYSMLKSTLKIYDRVDIEKYATLTGMLKQNSHGYEPKQERLSRTPRRSNFSTMHLMTCGWT